jgi:hypothetical protein
MSHLRPCARRRLVVGPVGLSVIVVLTACQQLRLSCTSWDLGSLRGSCPPTSWGEHNGPEPSGVSHPPPQSLMIRPEANGYFYDRVGRDGLNLWRRKKAAPWAGTSQCRRGSCNCTSSATSSTACSWRATPRKPCGQWRRSAPAACWPTVQRQLGLRRDEAKPPRRVDGSAGRAGET